MKRTVLILVAALLLVGAGLVMSQLGGREFTTCCGDAYELYTQGEEHINAFQWNDAVAKLEQATKIDPDFAMATAALVEGYGKLGQATRRDSTAVLADSLAALLEDDTERMLVELRLSGSSKKSVHGSERDSLLTALKEVVPDHLMVLAAEAAQAKRHDDPDAAERVWQRVVEKNPNYALAYNELGYLAYYGGDYDEAIRLLQRYAYLAPDIANPHDSLGEVLMHLGRYEEAEKKFTTALSYQPDYISSLISIAQIYIARGQLHKGVTLLEKIRVRYAGTSFEEYIDQLAIGTYYINQLWDDLATTTGAYIARYPDSDNTVFYRAIRLTVVDNNAAAQAVMDSALVAWRDNPYYDENEHIRRRVDSAEAEFQALLCENDQKPAEAADHWHSAIALMEPDKMKHDLFFARIQYGRCLLAEDRNEEALAQAVTVLEINPRQIRALVVAIEANLALGRRTVARKYLAELDSALVKADSDFAPLLRAAELHQQLDQPTSTS